MNIVRLAMVFATGVALSTAAHATPVITYGNDFTLANFGSAGNAGLVSAAPIEIANGGEITFDTGGNPQTGVYYLNSPNVAISPAGYSGTYLAAEPGGSVNIALGTAKTSFSLLWGSIDTYNTIQLYSGSTLVDTVVGGVDVKPADQTSAAYVTITETPGVTFDKVVLTSTGAPAFEFVPSVQVPEPASLAVLGMGLACIGLVRRRGTSRA